MLSIIQYNSKKLSIILCFAAIAMVGCKFYFDTTKDTFTVQPTNAGIEHGKNLTYNLCGGCHYDAGTKKFIGKELNDLPKIGGKLYSANLTQSGTNGIPPNYTDAELFYLLKTGIARSGKYMPYMMKPMMADEDINDIISYLRSTDAAVAAADTTIGTSRINLIGRTGIRFASNPTPYNTNISRPDEKDTTAYGRYLVAITGCYHCHSKKVLGLDYLNPEKSKGYMQGGMKLKDKEGKKLFGPNLTPDKETGIGNYSLADFSKAVTEGITPAGTQLSVPMPKFTHLSDKEVKAIYVYINSLEPKHHKVK